MGSSWGKSDQECRLEELFISLEADFAALDKGISQSRSVTASLKEITRKLKDAKALIHEFEREARTDGMPARELADRKRRLANQLNAFIARKKAASGTEEGRNELLAGAAAPMQQPPGGAGPQGQAGLSVQELIKDGRRGVQEIDGALNRAEKVVEDTLQIGQQTAATLHEQTQQLNKVVDDLNEIEFSMKKATKVIADIGKGIMTDRCIMFLLFLVVCGVIALVIVKVVKPNKTKLQDAAASAGLPTWNSTEVIDSTIGAVTDLASRAMAPLGGRRLLWQAPPAVNHGTWLPFAAVQQV